MTSPLRVVTLLLLCFAGLASSSSADSEARPNILMIVADDLGFSDLGAYGGEIDTPVLDGLARRSTRFTNFHVAAVCSPTRAMLLTGVDNHANGLGNMGEFLAEEQIGAPGYEGHLNDRVVTLAEALKGGGYRTVMAGKWHLGDERPQWPGQRGFDRSFASLGGSGDNWSDRGPAPILPRNPFTQDGRRIERPEGHSSRLYVDHVLEAIEDGAGEGEAPFFAYLAFQAVHYPHQAPGELVDKYQERFLEGWDVLRRRRFERIEEMGLLPGAVHRERDPSVPAWKTLDAEAQREEARRMAAYAAMLEDMDAQLGRLLDALSRSGRLANTVIVFLSDNGADVSQPNANPLIHFLWYRSQYPDTSLEGIGGPGAFSSYGPQWAQVSNEPLADYKGSPWSGAMRVPMMIHLPGKQAEGTTNAFAYVTDLMPTLLEIARIEAPTRIRGQAVVPMSGRSMLAHLRGESATIHPEDRPTGYELMGNSSLFLGRYKLLRRFQKEWHLFDIVADPSESRDLATREPERLGRMQKLYREYEERHTVVPVPPDYDVMRMVLWNSTLWKNLLPFWGGGE